MMQTIDQFIAQYIPAAQALNLSVVESSLQRVAINAPFESNCNHHHTIFGGSQALLATLSALSLVYLMPNPKIKIPRKTSEDSTASTASEFDEGSLFFGKGINFP